MHTKLFNLENIKIILEKDGFATSWSNPFMEWQRPDLYDGRSEVNTCEILYVRDPPVSWIIPFDLALIAIRIDDEGIFFELSLYYADLLEDQIDASVINNIYDHHQYWRDQIAEFYADLAEQFSLKWDTENDYYIEDTLFGHLKSEESVLNILIMLKNKDEKTVPRVSWNDTVWSSDILEIDCKLKKYRDRRDSLDKF